MTEIDMLLRDTLNDHAEQAPAATGLLVKVHRASGRLRRRRRLAVAGTGMAAVVLASAAVPAVAHLVGDASRGGGTTGAPLEPGPTRPAPGQPGTNDRPTAGTYRPFPVVLAAAKVGLPAFPFAPAMDAVPGLAAPVATVHGGRAGLRHDPADLGAPSIVVQTSTDRPSLDGRSAAPPSTRPQRVRGVDGVAAVADGSPPAHFLLWQEPSGTWVLVEGNSVDADALVRYAERLTPGSVPVLAPLTFTTLPRGLEVDVVEASAMSFRPPDVPAGSDFAGQLTILVGSTAEGDTGGWPLRVGDRPARLIPQEPGRSLEISLARGRNLVVQVPANVVISDGDLMRFASGITVTDAAKAGAG